MIDTSHPSSAGRSITVKPTPHVRTTRTWRLTAHDGRLYDSDRPGLIGGYRPARIYGRLDCPSALRAIARGGYVRQRVFFADEAAACAAGYRPCGRCMPDMYAIWNGRQLNAPSTTRPINGNRDA